MFLPQTFSCNHIFDVVNYMKIWDKNYNERQRPTQPEQAYGADEFVQTLMAVGKYHEPITKWVWEQIGRQNSQ